jgi:hypothetical protein
VRDITTANAESASAYLDEIRSVDPWMFEEVGPALVVTLVEALGNLAVKS